MKPETVEEYYAQRPFIKTSDLNGEEGHFNVFKIETINEDNPETIAYGHKDYFKICVVSGRSNIHYADKSFEIKEYGLLFAHPLIPYNWEPLDKKQNGYTSIFTESFFEDQGNLKKYPFFQPGGYPVYELNETEFLTLTDIFKQIEKEKNSDFEYKNDVICNLIFQLIHSALKMRPATNVVIEKNNAPGRITALFMNLLESQFPIKNTIDGVTLRSASEFASQMAVHVNHLNKSVKEVTRKTTSELIAERLLKEAKIMLKHSSWAISEIAYTLGFEDPAHFSTFFRKQLNLSPSQYRNSMGG
ncbi:helix-turn-helix transcriptional regulator [Chryseobacterium sp. X308]|uniref:AraC family transcriptional regulator n=1 Tax=Chryseobacterium sp. X308 TaxID=2884873 RepID=UPI001D141824|nr:AraC family transcriptional regulator [Chryseobacterium sp. X308]MCC3216037.1 helix-turn-helix transcriptional regulator [Chryseobacterium sp. X308]